MEYRAQEIVLNYIRKHLDKSDNITEFGVYTVWKCKALQNWKFLISSTLLDGMYYEVTFNGDKNEWYLDAYKKFENQVIREPDADTPQTDCPWGRTMNIDKIGGRKPIHLEDIEDTDIDLLTDEPRTVPLYPMKKGEE